MAVDMIGIISFLKKHIIFFSSLLVCVLIYMFLFSALGKSPIAHDPYDQYTRQAKAWTEFKTDIPEKLSYLEVAEYKGKFYVSFPPVPSVFMIPVYLIFKDDTPNTLMNVLYIFIAFIAVYTMAQRRVSKARATFLSFFYVFASCALPLSMAGSVWFMAQILALCLSSVALALVTSDNKKLWNLSLLFLALSVGCRPFNALYFLPVYNIIICNLKEKGILRSENEGVNRTKTWLFQAVKYLWIPFVVMLCLMAYNYIRFDNPFVFGHKYLSNFSGEIRQFSFSYIINNIKNTFELPKYVDDRLFFPKLDGFAFWMCCPFFIYALFEFLFTKKKAVHWVTLVCFALHFVALLSHKTMGGFQFGSRYTIDLLPYALIVVYYGRLKNRIYPYILAAFGFMLNVYGTLYHYLGWHK